MKTKKIVEISAKELGDKLKEELNMPNAKIEWILKREYDHGGDFRDNNEYFVVNSVKVVEND